MKLTFNGDSLSEIHQQIIAAADELTREDIKDDDIIKLTNHNLPQTKEFISNEPAVVTAPTAWQEYDKAPVVLKGALPFAQPQSDGHVPAGTQSTKIDGYNVSDGKVWVPVEGRESAYTGVELDKYLAQKAAKESGGELDAAGTPYNPAIHTSTRTKTTKGLWKNRPGGGAAKAEVGFDPAKPGTDKTVETTFVDNKPVSVQQVVAHEDSAPAIGRAPSMHNYESFKTNLMTIVVRLINENKITRDYMKDLNAYFQVSNLWDVKNDDTKCQQLFKLFLEYQFIMGA